jgi:transcriptional regulator with XRE-family HTH domain
MDTKSNAVQPDGEKVRFHRIKMGLTQEDLENETQKRGYRVSKRTIERIEAGCSARINTIRILADALGVEPDALLKDNESVGRSNGATLSIGISPELANYFISFQTLIEDRTKDFTGRKFVFDKIEGLLHEQTFPCGYIVIEGDPGIGKSALMAQLIITRNYFVHHFNIALQSIDKPQQFLGNICARIIGRYELPHVSLPQDYYRDGSFFSKLLEEAAAGLNGSDRLIVVIDALDEVHDARQPGPNNLLFLPPTLPKNVYVIATTRRLQDLRLRVSDLFRIDIDAGSPANSRDVEAYVRHKSMEQGIARWITDRKLKTDEFVDLLMTKSEGNFMYLHYVFPAIERGLFTRQGLKDLPDGLKGYYRQHWAQMRQANTAVFDELYRPIICVLAAAKEAVQAQQVAKWTRLRPSQVQSVLETWREFLYEEKGSNGQRLYRIYHSTFREFLLEEVDPGLVEFHDMISDSGLDEIRGLGLS